MPASCRDSYPGYGCYDPLLHGSGSGDLFSKNGSGSRRRVTAGQPGAIDHIAFQVTGIEELYRKAREGGYTLMEDCAERVQPTTYWPQDIRWFIVIGPNGEKVEFSQIE